MSHSRQRFGAARRLFRRTVAALTPDPIPEGAEAHPDGGPGPYLPPEGAVPGPRVAPLGIPPQAAGNTARPRPGEADGFDPVAEAEEILRKAMP